MLGLMFEFSFFQTKETSNFLASEGGKQPQGKGCKPLQLSNEPKISG